MFLNFLFLISGILVVVSTLLLVFSRNLMHSCIFLLTTLFGVAGLYATLGADFLAATQLVVYSGGVVILMLFGVMLTGGISDTNSRFGLMRVAMMGDKKTYLVAILSSLIFLAVIYKVVMTLGSKTSEALTDITSPTTMEIGKKLLTDHILAFEISSVLLLGALVGAAVISRPLRN